MKVVNVSGSTYLPIQFAKSYLRIISICNFVETVEVANANRLLTLTVSKCGNLPYLQI